MVEKMNLFAVIRKLIRKGASRIKIKKTGTGGEAGFTLIEILVASMILLILISVTGFLVTRNVGKARTTSAKNQVQIFSMALNSYFLDCGTYPTTEQGLKSLIEKPILEPVPEGWDGPYLDKIEIPKDPWDKEYEYKNPGPQGLPFGIRSYGADGREGGENQDQDIVSWKN
jgi:general secretion pathway protein G